MHIVEKRVANVIAFNQEVEDIELLIGDRYIVEVLDIESVTESGIMLIDGIMTRNHEVGRVLVVGNGDRLETATQKEMYWKAGDVICMERLAGRDNIMLGGKPYRLINQAHTYFKFKATVVRAAEAEVANG